MLSVMFCNVLGIVLKTVTLFLPVDEVNVQAHLANQTRAKAHTKVTGICDALTIRAPQY